MILNVIFCFWNYCSYCRYSTIDADALDQSGHLQFKPIISLYLIIQKLSLAGRDPPYVRPRVRSDASHFGHSTSSPHLRPAAQLHRGGFGTGQRCGAGVVDPEGSPAARGRGSWLVETSLTTVEDADKDCEFNKMDNYLFTIHDGGNGERMGTNKEKQPKQSSNIRHNPTIQNNDSSWFSW